MNQAQEFNGGSQEINAFRIKKLEIQANLMALSHIFKKITASTRFIK
jgi:hypothetical protein